MANKESEFLVDLRLEAETIDGLANMSVAVTARVRTDWEVG